MRHWRTLSFALFLIVGRCTGTPDLAFADDPMNQPLDSVGVKDYDSKLCSDRWVTCDGYSRIQFDFKYPGTSLDSISLYPLSEAGSPHQVYRDPEIRDADEIGLEIDGEADED